MKKFMMMMVVVALFLVGCQPTTTEQTPEPHNVETPSDTQTEESNQPETQAPPEEPTHNEQSTEPAVTPIPDGELIPVDSQSTFTPILYSSGGRYLVLGGSHHGQWLSTNDFEGKLDGKIVVNRESLDEFGIRKPLEFALLKKGEAINFYSLDGCMGDGICDGTEFIIDGFQNVYYEAKINIGSGVDTPTIGLPNTSWNPFPFPGQSGGVDGYNFLIDIDKNEIMDTLIMEKKDMDDYKSFTLTLDMEGKRIPVTEIVEDGVYLSSRYIYFLDLNGDGQLEIIVAQEGHNLGVSVFDITESGAKEVMHLTIGD